MRNLVVCIAVMVSSVAAAQDRGFELTPTLGWVRGGNIVVEDRTFTVRDVSLDINSSGTYGLRFDIPLPSRFSIELMVQRQESEFEDEKALFGQEPGGFFPEGSTLDLLKVNLTHLHGGVIYTFGDNWSRWFVTGSAGVTEISPSLPLEKATRLSLSAGGGIKMDLNQRLGLRLEGRFYWIDTDDKTATTVQFQHPECYEGPCTYTYRYDSAITQLEVTAGLIIKF